MMITTVYGIILKSTATTILMMMVAQNRVTSSLVRIVWTMTMMVLIQIQMMMAGINPFGIKEYWVKDYFSLFTMMLTTITMGYQMAKILTMTTMVYPMRCKKPYVSPVKNRASGTTITMVS